MYPQSMFLSRNKKNNVYPCKPQFYYIKVGFKGSKLYRHVFVMEDRLLFFYVFFFFFCLFVFFFFFVFFFVSTANFLKLTDQNL